MKHLIDVLRRHYRELVPQPTGIEPRLAKLPEVRAVLFDVYGTLVISGSGEVGTTKEAASQAALEGALQEMSIPVLGNLDRAVEMMQRRVRAAHARAREHDDIEYPEIQAAKIWQEVLEELARRGTLAQSDVGRVDWERFAVEYEARANPCWPMPHLWECLQAFRDQQRPLGIISNAQFYTPLLFPALLGRTVEACGFDPQLQFYSYRHGRAKPGTALYQLAAQTLAGRGIEPRQTLYVGNDMLNDIKPAAGVGFRTALFAGDARSLRLRKDDPQAAEITPTLVITHLDQLAACTML